MTPGARVAAAIEILDGIAAGKPAEVALSRWARASRYAGSKDRAAVRDHVFDVLRHWRSDAARGGGDTGRARMIGRLRGQGVDPATLFDGVGHAPAPLEDGEHAAGGDPVGDGVLWDLPDWLVPVFRDSLGDKAADTARALTHRAPVTVRVNTARTDVETARTQLSEAGIAATPNPRASTALTITEGARRLRNSACYLEGLVEIQDAASQAAMLTISGQGTALDFCAGGGGKALALAALGWRVTAHDIDAKRMRDLPARAARGGHQITLCAPDDIAEAGQFDLVLCDAPCSGSGTWRRTPEAKWALTPARLTTLQEMQVDVLEAALCHVAPDGRLVYATCSVLRAENQAQIDAFLARHDDWQLAASQHWGVDEWGDGFYIAHLSRSRSTT
ncbi:RsmB/NOP family class I SAM-dependent RNA methyltransferase [Tateyamaria sp. SN3-11]|uniref:RsmB/NOP family class I SAM-dependent RNA methyltransferase n=1 Tax=Tateyamaria sp. SN3-11 TaxID=3092147 RepID=UPI0039EBFDC0